uniref:Uncharacterized protein n=1 Tax=Arion vulgaris TaxID=1028688 RepID=A0A0B7BJ96_9EUPU
MRTMHGWAHRWANMHGADGVVKRRRCRHESERTTQVGRRLEGPAVANVINWPQRNIIQDGG